jgi:hypothetical protein
MSVMGERLRRRVLLPETRPLGDSPFLQRHKRIPTIREEEICNDQSESSAGLKVMNDRVDRRFSENSKANLRSDDIPHDLPEPHTTICRTRATRPILHDDTLVSSTLSVTWKPTRDSKPTRPFFYFVF